jgi:hypothetical protein
VYSGSTSQATVTAMNASRLSADVFGSADTAGTLIGTSVDGGVSGRTTSGGLAGVARTLNHATRRALTGVRRAGAAGVTFNETEPCSGGGSVNTNGTIDDNTLTGTLTITFNNCTELGLTLNGSATAQVLEFDQVACGGMPTNFVATTSRITVRGNGVSADAGGSLQVITNIPTSSESVTSNLTNLNNLTGVMTKAEGLFSGGTLNSVCAPSSISNLAFNGQIFDNVHGFVDVSTITLGQANLSETFPNTGEIRLDGAAGTALHVRALSSTQVELQFDTNGDNAGDGFAARMNWTDLTGPIGADIADTPDGDGMHNSWETFYGLDPQVDDSALDREPDGANYLAEYIAGTNPNGP